MTRTSGTDQGSPRERSGALLAGLDLLRRGLDSIESGPRVRLPEEARRREKVLRALARRTAQRRSWLVGGALIAGYLALSVRAGLLMLGTDDRLQAKARIQFQQPVVLEARRGDILDREGGTLATSVPMPALHADPSRLQPSDARSMAASLAPILGESLQVLESQLLRSTRQDVLLGRDLHPKVARQAMKVEPKGVLWLEEENRRFYPAGPMASQLLGMVSRTGRGQGGVELTLDRFLRGETFKFVELRDRKGRGIRPAAAALRSAHQGHTAILTLDPVLQLAAERALDNIMVRSVPEAANLVVLDIRTGEILAMANRPSGNANDPAKIDQEQLKNRSVMDAVEPGSVFKPFAVALALENGFLKPDDMVDCENGAWRLANKTITDTHPHGVISVTEVVKYSSNIGAAKVALKTGPEIVVGGLRDFGFGRPVELSLPGEISGILRSAATIKPIELATTAYGQGVTASTVQLAAGVATLANDGVRMKPHIVKEIRDRRGDVVWGSDDWVDRVVVSRDVARTVSRMMVTVTEEGGTGTKARVPGYPVAGKTGTAWKVVDGAYSSTARISSFVGFLPADDPVVAIAVVVDTATVGSKYGGLAAAPAFSEVGAVAMRHFGIEPRPEVMTEKERKAAYWLPSEEAAPPAPVASNGSLWVPGEPTRRAPELSWADAGHLRLPDLSGLSMRDILALFEGSGLELTIQGNGLVVQQSPAPLALVAPGQKVEVRLQ